MTLDASKIQDGDKMVDSPFTRSLFQKPSPMMREALRRADILKSMQKNSIQACSKCQARLENPHADYHLTALIDDSKI